MCTNTCLSCGKVASEVDRRKWHVAELAKYAVRKEVGIGFPTGGTWEINAWKMTILKTFEMFLCNNCKQQMLQAARKKRPYYVTVSVIVTIITAFPIWRLFHDVIPDDSINKYFFGMMGGLFACVILWNSVGGLAPESVVENVYKKKMHDKVNEFKKEIKKEILVSSTNWPTNDRSLIIVDDNTLASFLTYEERYGWSVIQIKWVTPLATSDISIEDAEERVRRMLLDA
jgi:hypothetical protein